MGQWKVKAEKEINKNYQGKTNFKGQQTWNFDSAEVYLQQLWLDVKQLNKI